MKIDSPEHLVNPAADLIDGLLPSLAWLGSGLLGHPVLVCENSAASRTSRTIITNAQVVISRRSIEDALVPASELYRATVAHAVAHLLYSPLKQPGRLLKPMSQVVVSSVEDARVERLLTRRYPGATTWFLSNLAPVPDPGNFSFEALMARMDRSLADPDYVDDNHWVNKARQLFEDTQRSFGLEDAHAFRSVASILANDLGQMRVRFDPQHLWFRPPTGTTTASFGITMKMRRMNNRRFPPLGPRQHELLRLSSPKAVPVKTPSRRLNLNWGAPCTPSGTISLRCGAATGVLWSRRCLP